MVSVLGIIDVGGLDAYHQTTTPEDIAKFFQDPNIKPYCSTSMVLYMLTLRAMNNGQRMAVVVYAEIEEEFAGWVEELRSRDPILAAEILLKNSSKFGLHPHSKANWEYLKKLEPRFQGELDRKEIIKPLTLKALAQ